MPQIRMTILDGPAFDQRKALLQAADVGTAADLATVCADHINKWLNQARVSKPTSLLARALAARALLQAAAEWWSDDGADQDVADEALRSFLDLLPPGINGVTIDMRAEAK